MRERADSGVLDSSPLSLRYVRRRSRAYLVTLERAGASPLVTRLLVRAPSRRQAGALASCLAERDRGGTFAPIAIRRAGRTSVDYDDVY